MGMPILITFEWKRSSVEAHGCSLGMGTKAMIANCSVRLTLCPLQLDGEIRTNDLASFSEWKKSYSLQLVFFNLDFIAEFFLTCKFKCFV